MKRHRIAIVIGTRPEAIKMAPVIQALKKRAQLFDTVVISTAQHRQMLDQVFSLFEIIPDIDLDIMRPNQSLNELAAHVLSSMDKALHDLKPDFLLVQGDTTTVLAASLAAFYNHIPVGHVEAGLRSHDVNNPFPEEMNRRLTTVLAGIHFAPTVLARQELLKEGIHPERIIVTGNTIVDALLHQLERPFNFKNTSLAHIPFENHRVLLVTSHRRESWGEDLRQMCLALEALVKRFSDVIIVYPVHMNPRVHEMVTHVLGGKERIFLIEPQDYLTFLNLMKVSYLILTDSGGVQEEAPTLKKPLLVLRKLTERPEAMRAGQARVIGTNRESIVEETSCLLNSEENYKAMIKDHNPFGDGQASERIACAVTRWFSGERPLLEPEKEFVTLVSR